MSPVIAALVILSIICLSFVYIRATQCDVCDIFPSAQRILGQNGQRGCWLAYRKSDQMQYNILVLLAYCISHDMYLEILDLFLAY